MIAKGIDCEVDTPSQISTTRIFTFAVVANNVQAPVEKNGQFDGALQGRPEV